MRFPYWLSSMTVAAMMFAQAVAMPLRAPARAPEPAPARAPQATAMVDRAPRQAPARADQFLRVNVRAAQADVQAEQSLRLNVRDAQASVQAGPAGGGDEAPASKGKLIVIDPGHGGNDPGASHEANGQTDVTEEDANLAVAQKLADMLRADGYDAKLTRDSDANVGPGGLVGDLQARVDTANEAHANLLVSVHLNAAENHDARGTEVWYCADRPFSDDGEKLAKAVEESLVRNLHQVGYDTPDHGIRDDAAMGHFAITGPNLASPSEMPSIIGEPLFITNDQDAQQIKNPDMQNVLARGYFEGIKAYFGDS